MYIVCSLNYENYSCPEFCLCRTMDDAKKKCIKNAMEEMKMAAISPVTEEDIVKDMALIVNNEGTFFNYNKDGIFYVNQIITIDDLDMMCQDLYLCVWHHAYEGVSFEVLCIGNNEECIEKMRQKAEKIQEECYYDVELCLDDEKQCVIDTGNEWEVVSIVQIASIRP